MSEDDKPEYQPKGVFVIIMIFFATFVVYYFMNWKFLSESWKIG